MRLEVASMRLEVASMRLEVASMRQLEVASMRLGRVGGCEVAEMLTPGSDN